MKILIIGAGYVGAVTGASLAVMGHRVSVVDKDENKVAKLREGKSPISEPGLEDLLRSQVSAGNLRASTDLQESAVKADLVLVSVGTPTNKVDGSADLRAVTRVFSDLATVLLSRTSPLAIAITSTVPPGTTNNVARKILKESGVSEDKYVLSFIPEFLREGTAIDDFMNPTRFILGVDSKKDADPFLKLRPDLSGKTHIVGIKEAELLKTVENAWHATKVVFANEVGRVSDALGVSGAEVMNLLILDNRQNISKTYLRPGFAFGGSCLPKDVRSLVRLTEVNAVQAPLLNSLILSNNQQINYGLEQIISLEKRKILVLGLAFKANTDDVRESPALDLIQQLLGRGYDVKVHDFEALKHDLYGANLAAVENHSHIKKVLVEDLSEAITDCQVVVLTQHNKKYFDFIKEELGDRDLVDLTGTMNKL